MYTVEYYEYDWNHNLIAQGVYNSESKQDIWNEFAASIAEHYHGKDFWRDFNWNDNLVESVHDAEDGYNICLLRKWEGFDKNVSLSWKCDNTRYKSLKELQELAEFVGCTKECDRPYVVSVDGDKIAYLDIETNWNE